VAPTAAQFTERAAAVLREDGLLVSIIGPLLLEVQLDAERLAQLRLHTLHALAGRPLSGGEEAALDRLRATVRAQARPARDPERVVPYLRTTAQLAPLLASDPLLPCVAISGGLWATFVFDLPEHLRQLRRRDADLLRLTDARLLGLARGNLARRPGLALRTEGPLWRVVLDGELDASVLLLPAFWEAHRDTLGAGPLALALSPGVLLCAPDGPGGAALRATARARHSSSSSSSSSSSAASFAVPPLLQRRDGAWIAVEP
jgi:hypothetical protein